MVPGARACGPQEGWDDEAKKEVWKTTHTFSSHKCAEAVISTNFRIK